MRVNVSGMLIGDLFERAFSLSKSSFFSRRLVIKKLTFDFFHIGNFLSQVGHISIVFNFHVLEISFKQWTRHP